MLGQHGLVRAGRILANSGCSSSARRGAEPCRQVGRGTSSAQHSLLGRGRMGRVAVVPMIYTQRSNALARMVPNCLDACSKAPLELGRSPFLPSPSGRTLGRRGATPTRATKARPLRCCASSNLSNTAPGDRLAASWRGCWSGVRRTPEEASRTPNSVIGTQSPKSLAASWDGPSNHDQFCLAAGSRSILA